MMGRTSLQSRSLLWVAGSAVGAVVVALPDADDRVFSLSETHGPSPLDLLGVAILIGSWLPVATLLPGLWRTAHRTEVRRVGALAAAGAVGLVTTIVLDLGWWWLVAVAALVAAQALLLAHGWRDAAKEAPDG